jgi:hypothetical protein
MSNNIIEFTSSNPIDKTFEENEDALRVEQYDNSKKLIAISDGAGGVGIYCKQWAEFIVANAPEIADINLASWFLSASKEFYLKYCDVDFGDVETKEKFISGGSYATLLFLWIDYDKKLLNYVAVGDSSLFIFRKVENGTYLPSLIYPINDNEFIDQNPTLLNWKKANQIDSIKTFSLQEGDILIAGTDSISRWILENLLVVQPTETRALLNPNFKIDNETLEKHKLSEYSFKKTEDIFEAIPKDKTEAIKYFENFIKNNFMEADDITLYAEMII